MLEPNGPLPPEIYWRRRALAIGALVVALALVIWLVLTVSRGGDSPGDSKPVAAGSSTSVPSKTADPSTPKPSGSAESSAPPATSAAPASNEPAAGQCPDQSLAIKISVDQPTYRVGEQPNFRMVITNISSTQCQRDMNSAQIQASVLSLDGQRRFWTSSDCSPVDESNARNLKPGEQALFTVRWSGTTSQQGCVGERVPVPAGAYQVVAQFGSLHSAPEPFNLTPA
ncbi:hypothetical protein NBRGN_025_00030 [Nocardia brasiliensis NBRC 14402]|uniref:hypothetical protein n=1 Tax=Nocardia brasiliensis TaxID=37326 RepID=UPI00031F987B|nr:hypothetical protein [Nocardia brasiliensis]ASF10429.1 hypothetical protein CEQ30_27075 [Nocardia brasiliensis]GAJ80229.1 hypothetical protein NBRGN_025_00030 [Nocardia brasiliensis NBRC 14402]SUB11077.1 Uncharacterised protein [Nocardia brasiliensis]